METNVDNRVISYISRIYKKFSLEDNIGFAAVLRRFVDYEANIKHWTYRQNLVSSADVENLWKKHFIPSLKPLELDLIESNATCMDAGSGAGFPGIPIKIMLPDIRLTLVESNRKKSLFLRQTIEKLGLDDINVRNCRVEQIEGKFAVVMSRAMGKPQLILNILSERLADGGKMILWTAREAKISISGFKVESFNIKGAGKLVVLRMED